jgi:hypothetical protein
MVSVGLQQVDPFCFPTVLAHLIWNQYCINNFATGFFIQVLVPNQMCTLFTPGLRQVVPFGLKHSFNPG